ncbi:hypothetical protein K491DRAFT_660219 [Lophiostoma macrostomum CBS 122681]|uniref:Uncharacterized protein n=1 Tax=Lophiostoma macrostomum CBS 122681 TaxID=1314788 RepID=A0A6A6T5J0_9PLEO|nr:hypothetical protein K491DRAFT_660219 [Lophiostoma macrostomum CBS 122681]
MPVPNSKSVAVIGAGPGGLIAARKLLKSGFAVTIYEKGPRVGGLWDRESLINPDMQANFSIFTVSFSDLAWESIEMGTPPAFPKAWMVEAYLNEYANRYIPDSCFQFNTKVVRAERVKPTLGQGKTWKLTTSSKKHIEEHVSTFDYIVIASGYLSTPKPLPCTLSPRLLENPPIPIIHSTQCRNISQLMPGISTRSSVPQKVLVIGGSHSGSEITTSLALQASNFHYSPSLPSVHTTDIEIIHITPHQMFASPCFPRDYMSPTCTFEPFEYKVFDRATRPQEPLTHEFGLTNPQENAGMKMLMQTVVNGSVDSETLRNDLPPYGVVSETYNQFVQDERIRVIVGQVKSLNLQDQNTKAHAHSTVTATVLDQNGQTIELEGITAIVNATGFNSADSLSFLSSTIKADLGFDPDSARLPLILDASYLSQRSNVPDIAVLGFTGVNWGVMEMQARAISRRWSGEPIPEDAETCKAVAQQIVQFRHAIKENRRSEIPQVLFGDYIGLMESGAQDMRLRRVNGAFGEFEGMVCPARYIDSPSSSSSDDDDDDDKAEAEKMMKLLQTVQHRARTEGLYLARAVFLGLQGRWTSPTDPDHEEWTFHPRLPTRRGFEMEYLAIGDGINQDADSDSNSDSDSRTVFRYDEVHDQISAWTVDPDDALSAQSLAFTLKFDRATEPSACSARVVRGESGGMLVDEEMVYTFGFKGCWLDGFRMQKEMGDGAMHVVEFVRPGEDDGVVVEDGEVDALEGVGNKAVVQMIDLPSLKLES